MKKRDLIGTLQMQLKAAQHKIDGYESGKRYQMLEDSHRKSRRHYQRIIEQKNARIRELEHMIIPGISEPPVRTLRATIPENERHIFR